MSLVDRCSFAFADCLFMRCAFAFVCFCVCAGVKCVYCHIGWLSLSGGVVEACLRLCLSVSDLISWSAWAECLSQ